MNKKELKFKNMTFELKPEQFKCKGCYFFLQNKYACKDVNAVSEKNNLGTCMYQNFIFVKKEK